jgi:hypothetical protein
MDPNYYSLPCPPPFPSPSAASCAGPLPARLSVATFNVWGSTLLAAGRAETLGKCL